MSGFASMISIIHIPEPRSHFPELVNSSFFQKVLVDVNLSILGLVRQCFPLRSVLVPLSVIILLASYW